MLDMRFEKVGKQQLARVGHDPDQTPQARLAKYEGRIALVGAFAAGFSIGEEAREEADKAARKVQSLKRNGFFDAVRMVGIWSLAPPIQPSRSASLGGTASLLRDALAPTPRLKVMYGSKPLPATYAESNESHVESAHNAINTAVSNFEQAYGALPLKKVAFLIVTDPLYTAMTFGGKDHPPFDEQEISVLTKVDAAWPADNIWTPPAL